jgi:cysteinyl-tRNA synthetase, unknown class
MSLLDILLFVGLFAVALMVAYFWGRSQVPGGQASSGTQATAASASTAHDEVQSPMAAKKPTAAQNQNRPLRPAIGPASSAADAAGRPPIAAVASWGYQLQKLDVPHAAASPFDLLVIDYSHDGSQDQVVTADEMAQLKRKPDGSRRLVLAYVSVGEAEDYRFYWNDAWKGQKPAWLLPENKEWKGNFPVCFWEPGWQQVVCGSPNAYLDRVQALGFDGVYLDKCDVFEDMKERLPKVAATRPNLERDMVQFITGISRYLKSHDPGFLIVMQNAEVLLEHKDLVQAIDGVAKESLLFGLNGPEKVNAPDEVEFATNLLQKARAAGKAVLAVEYLNNAAKIQQAADTLKGSGIVLYVAPKDRNLKKLNYDVPQA